MVHKISSGGAEGVISIGKELYDFILEYNVAMRGQIEGDEDPCNSNFFRNTKGKSFDYGIGKDIAQFKEKYDSRRKAIARRALAMYRERPGDAEIKRLTEEYNLYKITQTKMASLWKPPMGRMKRQTSTGKMPKHKLADAEVCQEVCQAESAQKDLLQHMENQDWPNLIIGQGADRERVVRATKIIEKGIYVCNFDGLVLEPNACKAFLENAEAHSDDPELGRTEYCMIFKFDGSNYGKPCGKWMINANNEPEAVGLKNLLVD